eukprot:7544827-Pyramimonas_sp.AAC.1
MVTATAREKVIPRPSIGTGKAYGGQGVQGALLQGVLHQGVRRVSDPFGDERSGTGTKHGATSRMPMTAHISAEASRDVHRRMAAQWCARSRRGQKVPNQGSASGSGHA